MMRRQIFIWMGLMVLFLAFGISQAASAALSYKVRPGDTLSGISKRHGVGIEAIRAANGLHGDALKVGRMLLIPGDASAVAAAKTNRPATGAPAYHIVKQGDSLYAISRRSGVSVNDLKEINDLQGNRLRIGQRLALARPAQDSGDGDTAGDVPPSGPDALADGEELEDDEAAPLAADQPPVPDAAGDDGAGLLGKWNNPQERMLLARVATGFLGAPYRLGGSSIRGIDCSAFVRKIYEFFDVSLPRTAREQARVGKRVSRDELEVGDLVFFNTRRRAYSHVGVYIGNNEFVHASSGRARAVRVDTLDQPYYNKRFVGATRLKSLDEGI